MNYQNEQQEWDNFIIKEIGDKAELISVSVTSSDNRVYLDENSVYKIRRLTPASVRGRLNSLEDECLFMKRLTDYGNIASPISYKRLGQWEILEMTKISRLIIHDPTFGQPREQFKDFLRIIKFAWSINRIGCSHGDYHFQNIGLNQEGELSIFDFDQATIANPLQSFMRDFFGLGKYARPNDISLFRRAGNVQFIWLPIKAYRIFKKVCIRLLQKLQKKQSHYSSTTSFLNERVALLNDSSLNLLTEAWDKASSSNASSPGSPLAYYSIDINGVNFPGERPWLFRWNTIHKSIIFEEKSFLELGCNMGLLALHAKLSGAKSCLGVDVDHDIVGAAKLVAQAFNKDVSFRQLNLDDPIPWEDELGVHDIVSLLSVIHWVKDKNRVWNFIGKHKEVIYEGHESDSEAEQNLRKAGFNTIISIGLSERGRKIFHAVK